MFFTITGVKKIVPYTEDLVISGAHNPGYIEVHCGNLMVSKLVNKFGLKRCRDNRDT